MAIKVGNNGPLVKSIKVGLPNTIVKKITVGTPINVHASSGNRTIDNLGGVDTTSKQQGQILVYDSSQGVGGAYTTSNLVGQNGITTSFAAGSDQMNITLDGTTSNVPEGTRLYYTTARADSAFDVRLATKTTDDLTEGSNVNRRYFQDAYVDSNIKNADTEIADNVKITFGADSDLKIYHDTSNSVIREDGTGSLIIASNNVNLRNQSMTETLASFLAGGSVTLNYNDVAKLRTDSNGVTIFGRLSVDSVVGKYIGFDSDFNAKSTSDLSEGTNLYYTRARMDSDHLNVRSHLIPLHDSSFDLGSSSKKWKDLYLSGKTIHLGGLKISDSSSELLVVDSNGNPVDINLEGAKGTIRGFITTVDAGGDGSFTYDSADGRFTYTGPSAAEVRAHFTGNKGLTYNSSTGNFDIDSANVRGMFSGAGDLTYNSGTGQFSIDVEQVYSKANFDSDLGDANTGQLPEGANLYYTNARARAAISGNKGLTYNSSTGVMDVDSANLVVLSKNSISGNKGLTYNATTGVLDVDSANIRGMFSGGTGITYNSGSGAFTTTDGDIVHDNLSGFVGNEHIDHTAVSIVAGKGLTGGGTIASNRTIDVDSANLVTLARTAISGTNGISYTSGTGVIRAAQPLDSSANPTFNQLRGPSTFIIDPAAIGDSTGTVRILGNLTVEGATTTINSSTISIDDKNIQIADSATDSAGLDGGGITWGGAAIANSPTFNYSHSSARFVSNREINATLFSGSGASLTSLPAGQLTGTIDSARIPSLAAGDIGSGTIDSARIPALSISDISDVSSINHDALSGFVGNEHIDHSTVSIIAGKGLSGGGTIASSRTIDIDSANVKGMISVSDAGGDGSLAYNNSSGVLTYTGPSASEVRAHFSGGNGISISSGVIKLDSGELASMYSTTHITEGNNLYYTTARADSDAKAALFAIDAGGDGSFTYDSATGVMTYTGPSAAEVRAHISGNKGLSYNSSTGVMDVDSTNLVTLARASISGNKGLSYNSTTGVMNVDSANLVTMSRAAISVTGEGSYNSTTGVITLPTLGTHYLDSAIALTLIDANALDSGRATGLIDSAYVQLRQTTTAGDGGIAMAIALG